MSTDHTPAAAPSAPAPAEVPMPERQRYLLCGKCRHSEPTKAALKEYPGCPRCTYATFVMEAEPPREAWLAYAAAREAAAVERVLHRVRAVNAKAVEQGQYAVEMFDAAKKAQIAQAQAEDAVERVRGVLRRLVNARDALVAAVQPGPDDGSIKLSDLVLEANAALEAARAELGGKA